MSTNSYLQILLTIRTILNLNSDQRILKLYPFSSDQDLTLLLHLCIHLEDTVARINMIILYEHVIDWNMVL